MQTEETPTGVEPTPADAGFGAKLRRLGSESLIYGLSTILGRFLNFLLTPFYAAHFDTNLNGVQSAVYTFIAIVSIVFYLGMDVAYMRNSAAHEGDPRGKQRAFTMSFSMVALFGGLVTAVGLVAAPLIAPLFRLDPAPLRYMIAIVYTDALLPVPRDGHPQVARDRDHGHLGPRPVRNEQEQRVGAAHVAATDLGPGH